jgi:hypothetical protein
MRISHGQWFSDWLHKMKVTGTIKFVIQQQHGWHRDRKVPQWHRPRHWPWRTFPDLLKDKNPKLQAMTKMREGGRPTGTKERRRRDELNLTVKSWRNGAVRLQAEKELEVGEKARARCRARISPEKKSVSHGQRTTGRAQG